MSAVIHDFAMERVYRQPRYSAAENLVDEWVDEARSYGPYNPLVVILRGMYGSGKSTFANELVYHAVSNNLTVCVCSADTFFTDVLGRYHYDGNQITRAHDDCFALFRRAFEDKESVIVVDNTCLSMDEFRHYYEYARQRTHYLNVVEFECPDVATALEFRDRSIHDIPVDIVPRRWQVYNWNRLPANNEDLMVIDTT